MLQLEFDQKQDGIFSTIRVSFLNSSLFLPTESQKLQWDKFYLRYRIPKCVVSGNVVIWQKEDLQSLYYWATGGLKHMDMEPFKVSHKESLKWILKHYRTTLQMHWDDKASGIKLLSWKFMKGKVEWGNLHIQVEYPLLSKPVTPDLSTLHPFDKRKALQFLIDNPKMNLRYKQVVPQKMTALAFFQLYYKDLFSIAYSKDDILCLHRQAAMLQAKPVLKQAYETHVKTGLISHSDFFCFAISRDRVDRGIDEQQLGSAAMVQLFKNLSKEETLQYKKGVVSRLRSADALFDLRETFMEKQKVGYGLHESKLVYNIDFDTPGKMLLGPSCNLIQQINVRSDRELNKI